MAKGKGWVYIPGTQIPSMHTAAGVYARTTGIRTLSGDVNNALSALQGVTIKGLLAAATYLRADMDKTPPLIPVDTNNLRASWFVHKHPNSTTQMPLVIAGFDAALAPYAVYVHEMTTPPYGEINWGRPGSGPKFLEEALKRNSSKIVKIVAANLKKAIK